MSRIGRKPISIPDGVRVQVDGSVVRAEGPKGKLTQPLSTGMTATIDGTRLVIARGDDSRTARALHGLTRSLVANMVKGVTEGFSKKLTLVGVGYRAQAAGDKVNLSLGFSHPIAYNVPTGVKAETPVDRKSVV